VWAESIFWLSQEAAHRKRGAMASLFPSVNLRVLL
jgi:hypothetical protein